MLLALILMVQQQPTQKAAALEHPGADPLMAADLRAACPSNIAGDRAALMRLEQRQSDMKVLASDPGAWFALGCTRALLAANGALSRGGTMMIVGDSWTWGAIKSLVKALSLRAGDRRAADLLAILAMNEAEPRYPEDIAQVLDRAVSAGAVGNATLRGCADFGMRAGLPEITRRCATRALADGKDSTWHSLLLARLDFRDADTVNGMLAFVRAAAAAHDTLAKLAITWQLQWFLAPDEEDVWATLPDSARGEWVHDRLASRDVRDGQPAGARLAEHFKRLDHADSAFRLNVARVMRSAMLTSTSATGSIDEGEFRDYKRWQIDLDDRGVTWMRFGKPEKIGFADSIEVWYYQLDGKPLLLTFGYEPFSGSIAPSRLITGHIGDVYCGLDAFRCRLSMQQVLNPEDRQHVREDDRTFISAATTTDDNSVRTDKTIEVISRLHRLWDPISGASVAMLTYALKASDLVVQQDSGAHTARVEFDFRRWDAITDQWRDTAFTRRFTTTLAGARRLTGFIVTPSSPTVTSWSLVATQSEARRGRAWDITTGPLDRGPLALSDLVLGQEGQGLVWAYHNVNILLAPLNAVDRKLPVSLYYQIHSEDARQGVRTTVALYRVVDAVARDTAALQVGFDQAIQAGVNEVAPTLDVSRLEKGSYRLEVRLTDAAGAVISRRNVQLDLN
jgi:hypothetical protein